MQIVPSYVKGSINFTFFVVAKITVIATYDCDVHSNGSMLIVGSWNLISEFREYNWHIIIIENQNSCKRVTLFCVI